MNGRWGRTGSLIVLGVVVLTAAVVAFAPVISTSTCVESSAGESGCSSSMESLVASEGAGVLGVLAVPVLIALVPVMVPSRRSAKLAAGLLTLAAAVSAASVGIFLVPTAVLAWVVAAKVPPAD